jgi:hypothetical protein
MKSWIATFLAPGSTTVRAESSEMAVREIQIQHPGARILSLEPVGGPPQPPGGRAEPAVLREAA